MRRSDNPSPTVRGADESRGYDDGPRSGVRLVAANSWSSTALEPEVRCHACGGRVGLRRLPPEDGLWFCMECVSGQVCDEFDQLYCDIGGGD
jgi:hypothetical protein